MIADINPKDWADSVKELVGVVGLSPRELVYILFAMFVIWTVFKTKPWQRSKE